MVVLNHNVNAVIMGLFLQRKQCGQFWHSSAVSVFRGARRRTPYAKPDKVRPATPTCSLGKRFAFAHGHYRYTRPSSS